MNNNPVDDEPQRQQAIDPSQSFIVQAPAGSGKTELLTQRFLVLLSYVKQPEEILAITFTKKSAADMHSRIINALQYAAHAPEPQTSHAKKTWNLAKNVLKQSEIQAWHLLDNPSRLRVQTMDSFNAHLTKQLPILSHFGAAPEITKDPTSLYSIAVKEFLSHLEENVAWSAAIAYLLIHLDNNITKVQELLINLLKKRDQWLPYITVNANDPQLRKKLEAHLASVSIDIMATLSARFPREHFNELLFLANFAAQNLKKENATTKIIYCADLSSLPKTSIADKNIWLGLAELFLTTGLTWRKRIDKSMGFPAPANSKNKQESALFSSMKKRMYDLITTISHDEELYSALVELNVSPACHYDELQWKTLNALHQVLCIVVAQLKLVFQQHGQIDFIESSQGALTALGTDEAPTDITLALDYQIRHILIDEFQDTSNSQYRLVEKLTAGWEPNDGRTLFVVGDPMQSIYRFREAEVGFFIRTREKGLNHIYLKPLTLTVNFRSVPGIINWVNHCFQKILPAFDNISTGAVSYSPSITLHNNSINSAAAANPVTLHALTEAQQAEHITKLISKIKNADPTEKIAILVRSRTHLATLIPALKKAGIAYQAIDIDPLNKRPIIQDLMSLTRALMHPADRIAWLAILRAPWCGLALSDLFILAGNSPNAILWQQLQSNTILQHLSADGQQRLQRILPILQLKMADRYRFSLRRWLESIWLLLGGPACIDQLNDLEDAKTYFNLLEELDNEGNLLDLKKLNMYVKKLYAAPNNQADDTLQIMTIHNAKGLEFDTVILPHLERKSPPDEKQLLLWMEHPRLNKSNALILAPIHASGQTSESIYSYIRRQNTLKNDYESGRLLYVAATRAKKRLHLFFSLQKEKEQIINPASNSLLEKLWNAVKHSVLKESVSSYHIIEHIEEDSSTLLPALKQKNGLISRLSLQWKNPVHENYLTNSIVYHNKKLGFQLRDFHAQYIGTLLHNILEKISYFGSAWWQTKPFALQKSYLQQHLLQAGVLPSQCTSALNNLFTAIKNTLHDPRGQWILQAHTDAKSEFALTVIIKDSVKSLIIDRTFVDEVGTRWIIDYKTTIFSGESLEKFLDEEQNKYTEQLWQYAQAMRAIDSRPIRFGLYFPSYPAWREWEFIECLGGSN